MATRKKSPAATTRRARTATAPRPTYHHGDLHTALLDAADALLDERGIEGMSLRECARRAGVSHGAPAHHFGDVAGLLGALCARYFEQFRAALAGARASAPGDAFDRLVAIGLAYFRFAAERPARFRLMFRTERLRLEALAKYADDGAYLVLRGCIEDADREGGGDGTLLEEKALLAHTLVHGFATLVLDNPGFGESLREHPLRARAILDRALRLARPAFEAHTIAAAADVAMPRRRQRRT